MNLVKRYVYLSKGALMPKFGGQVDVRTMM